MLYRDFGRTGWKISAIGLGTWNIGSQWGQVDDATAWATVRAAYDNGMNLFDTAESYGVTNGLSEERLGVALAGVRHDVYVVSKIGNWGMRTGQGVPKTTVDMIRLCAHASLHRLRTDFHDVLLCHDGGLEDPSVYLEGFQALQEEGRLRCYGISTNSLEVLKRFNRDGGCKVVQVGWSIIQRECETDLLPYCQAQEIAVMVRGPLARGLLSGKYTSDSVFTDTIRADYNEGGEDREKYLANLEKVDAVRGLVEPQDMVSTALGYVISHPTNPVAIPGAKSPEQAVMNAAAGDDELSEEELERLRV